MATGLAEKTAVHLPKPIEQKMANPSKSPLIAYLCTVEVLQNQFHIYFSYAFQAIFLILKLILHRNK